MRKKFVAFILFVLFIFSSFLYAKSKAIVLNIDDCIINPVVYEYIHQGLKKASLEEASIIIIKLDTPGGLLESTRKIVKEILNSKIPVVVFVYPQGARAASAGVFITISAHISCMSPSTTIGAAHPVMMNNSWGNVDEELRKKIINDTLSWVESIAKKRSRNINWVKKAVEKSVSIDEEEALKLKVIDLIAKDIPQLLEKLDGRRVKIDDLKYATLHTKDMQIIEFNMNLRQKILNALVNPQIAYILMLLGFFGLLYEVTHPGFGFPGIFGIVSLILSFYAFQILPVNYAGVALIVLGLVLLVVELLTPTFGIFTLGAGICLVLGSLMLFNQKAPFLRISLELIIGIVASLCLITLFLLTKVAIVQRKKPLTGKESLIGKVGVALTDINKKGKVEIEGSIWTALSQDYIKKDEEVIVERMEGLKLWVKRKVGS